MKPISSLRAFRDDEDGGMLALWGVSLVIFMGFLALVFDIGRQATTQSELQSFADTVSLAAAAELDGTSDAITRAKAAAEDLVSDSQTYAEGSKALSAADDVTLTFYQPDPNGKFTRSPALVTTEPAKARFVEAAVAERSVTRGFGAAFDSLRGADSVTADKVSASAVASFALEACNVAPLAVCLPALDFNAEASIGETLELHTSVSTGALGAGAILATDTLTDVLDGLSVCAGLSGIGLDACLIAARVPETACSGDGGLRISADVSADNILDSINTRFGIYDGIASGLANNLNFAQAPNLLAGLKTPLGLCLPVPNLNANSDIGLPGDDCLRSGVCDFQGNGNWTNGRRAYVAAHYNGTDPFPAATTRFEFYQAEVAAGVYAQPPRRGPLGTLLPSLLPSLCTPPTPAEADRRLMVVAGIDCASVQSSGLISTPPVQTFFEVFVLGPGKNGVIEVEITACLGGNCREGNLGTEVHDVVRLVE